MLNQLRGLSSPMASTPDGFSSGGATSSTPRRRSSSYVARQSSVSSTPTPSIPFSTIARSARADSSSMRGPGLGSITTISRSGWVGSPRVSQR
jgi:hypothetical protein